MLKIVDGIPFVGVPTDHYRVKAHDLGNGHVEVTASRVIAWHEADFAPGWLEDHEEVCRKFREENAEEIAERNRKRAARRARTNVRRLCKSMGADTMLTLTYAWNETSLDRCKADLKDFDRRLSAILPGFRMVAIFEPQKRGAWHVHIATAGIPTVLPVKGGGDFRSFNVLRAIWRAVTARPRHVPRGEDVHGPFIAQRGGNVDVSRRRRHSRKSAAQIAAYIAKYLGKAFEDGGVESGKNRWTKFGDVERPEPLDLGSVPSLSDALVLGYGLLMDRDAVASARLDRFKDWFFLAAEDPRCKKAASRAADSVSVRS
jgi:hypothetical protein